MEIKSLSVVELKRAELQVNSAIFVNEEISIVTHIENNVATAWTGKEYITVPTIGLKPLRLVVVHEQVGNSIPIKKDVSTDIDFKHFIPILTLAVNGVRTDGNVSRIFKPLFRGDAVRIEHRALASKFPHKTLKEVQDALGLVTNIKGDKYSVMVLNETVEFRRKDLINQNKKNSKFLFSLSEQSLHTAYDIISTLTAESIPESCEEYPESTATATVEPAPKPAPKPTPKPAPKPASKPASTTTDKVSK